MSWVQSRRILQLDRLALALSVVVDIGDADGRWCDRAGVEQGARHIWSFEPHTEAFEQAGFIVGRLQNVDVVFGCIAVGCDDLRRAAEGVIPQPRNRSIASFTCETPYPWSTTTRSTPASLQAGTSTFG